MLIYTTMKASREVNKTIDYYNEKAKEFTQDTVEVNFEERRNMLLKYLKPGTHILDLGCGSGRDSKAFIEKGYKVTAIDGSSELCKIASKYIGQEVICKRFDEINEVEVFDAVWACASLLHLPLRDLKKVLGNVSNALKPGGCFYSSFKYGDFEGDRNGRYFTDLTEESFRELIGAFEELDVVEVEVTSDVRVGREGEKWVNGVVRKKRTTWND